jgi:hypothetical protein
MPSKILLCVSAHQATASLFRGGKPGACRVFTNDEGGLAGLGELLRAHSGCPVYLLVDAVEEDYHTELLPHATGRARREMVLRKLKQVFRNTPYHTAWLQGREPDKRLDDRFLFAALTNPDLLRPWLEVIHAAGAPLAGIYLLPLVSQAVLDQLQAGAQDLLLVSRHPSGLHQSFFQQRQLKTSRLAPFDALEHGAQLDALVDEIGQTRLYLNSLRLLAHQAKLTVMVLDLDDSLEGLCRQLGADPSFACRRLSRADLAACFGIPLPILESSSYALHLAVVGRQPPPHNLAPAALTRGFWHYRVRRILYGAATALALAALGWSGANLYRQADHDARARSLAAQAEAERVRYLAAAREFPRSPAPAGDLRKAVEIAAALKEGSRTPERAMRAVSRALEASPEIALDQLRWKFGPVSPEAADATAAARHAAKATWRETGHVEGEIRPFHGDYRAAMSSVGRFAERLRNDKAVAEVGVTEMPLDVHSASGISGNTLDAAGAGAAHARFKLRMILKEGA